MPLSRREFMQLFGLGVVSTAGIAYIGIDYTAIPSVSEITARIAPRHPYGAYRRCSFDIDSVEKLELVSHGLAGDLVDIAESAWRDRKYIPDLDSIRIIVKRLGSAGTIDPMDQWSTVGVKIECVPGYEKLDPITIRNALYAALRKVNVNASYS